ncbi:MAG: GAK system XXXCH domain-containing protein [Thermodesulfobacteriota bacterium]
MDDGKRKWKTLTNQADTAALLRRLAEDIEAERFDIFDSPLEIAPQSEFKISLKQNPFKQSVEFKLEYHAGAHARQNEAQQGSPSAHPGKGTEDYDDLKERMQSDFKTLKEAATANILPEGATADRFIQDSRVMCTYPGKGDPYYEEYLAAVERFAQAVSAMDTSALATTVNELERLKKECHERYK